MPVVKQFRIDRRKKQSCYLLDSARNVTSQMGEDGIIEKVFELIGTKNKTCVEFGASSGPKNSNTYNLMINHGWTAVLIEGSPAKFAKLMSNYVDNPRAIGVCGLVEARAGSETSIEAYISKTPLPTDFDLISIDIDGVDYHVWESLRTYRPRVVVIEYNPTVPNDVVFIQDNDVNINQGCSLLALVELGKAKGYELACANGLNAIFVVKEEFPKLRIQDNHIDAMAYARWDAKYFCGYDGTLFHVGLHGLVWGPNNDVKIGVEELQVLPVERRAYNDAIKQVVPTS